MFVDAPEPEIAFGQQMALDGERSCRIGSIISPAWRPDFVRNRDCAVMRT